MKKLFPHRTAGLSFILVWTVVLLTFFYPLWIFNMFLVARLLTGFLLPHLFEATTVVYTGPTLYI